MNCAEATVRINLQMMVTHAIPLPEPSGSHLHSGCDAVGACVMHLRTVQHTIEWDRGWNLRVARSKATSLSRTRCTSQLFVSAAANDSAMT